MSNKPVVQSTSAAYATARPDRPRRPGGRERAGLAQSSAGRSTHACQLEKARSHVRNERKCANRDPMHHRVGRRDRHGVHDLQVAASWRVVTVLRQVDVGHGGDGRRLLRSLLVVLRTCAGEHKEQGGCSRRDPLHIGAECLPPSPRPELRALIGAWVDPLPNGGAIPYSSGSGASPVVRAATFPMPGRRWWLPSLAPARFTITRVDSILGTTSKFASVSAAAS